MQTDRKLGVDFSHHRVHHRGPCDVHSGLNFASQATKTLVSNSELRSFLAQSGYRPGVNKWTQMKKFHSSKTHHMYRQTWRLTPCRRHSGLKGPATSSAWLWLMHPVPSLTHFHRFSQRNEAAHPLKSKHDPLNVVLVKLEFQSCEVKVFKTVSIFVWNSLHVQQMDCI